MMLKPGSSGWMRWSYAALIPVLGCFMFICNPVKAVNLQASTETFAEDVAEQEESTPRRRSEMMLFEQMPRFNGGGANEFSRWLNGRLQVESDVEGHIVVQFTVGADGNVRDIKVISGLREDLDEAVARAVASSPKWEPGINAAGEPASVTFSVPVFFSQS